jgi:hypothetical protein
LPTKQRFRRPRLTSKGKRSKFEEKVEALLKKKGISYEYEKDTLPYSLHLKYKPDWTVGNDLFVEAKGRFDYTERRKMLAVKDANPNANILVVFMRDQKIAKNSKTTYTEWCKKHGIECCVYPELPL